MMSDSDFEDEGEGEFEVEYFEKAKKQNGTWQYLIKWYGYPPEQNNWEPESNLSCQELMDSFWKRHGGLEGKKELAPDGTVIVALAAWKDHERRQLAESHGDTAVDEAGPSGHHHNDTSDEQTDSPTIPLKQLSSGKGKGKARAISSSPPPPPPAKKPKPKSPPTSKVPASTSNPNAKSNSPSKSKSAPSSSYKLASSSSKSATTNVVTTVTSKSKPKPQPQPPAKMKLNPIGDYTGLFSEPESDEDEDPAYVRRRPPSKKAVVRNDADDEEEEEEVPLSKLSVSPKRTMSAQGSISKRSTTTAQPPPAASTSAALPPTTTTASSASASPQTHRKSFSKPSKDDPRSLFIPKETQKKTQTQSGKFGPAKSSTSTLNDGSPSASTSTLPGAGGASRLAKRSGPSTTPQGYTSRRPSLASPSQTSPSLPQNQNQFRNRADSPIPGLGLTGVTGAPTATSPPHPPSALPPLDRRASLHSIGKIPKKSALLSQGQGQSSAGGSGSGEGRANTMSPHAGGQVPLAVSPHVGQAPLAVSPHVEQAPLPSASPRVTAGPLWGSPAQMDVQMSPPLQPMEMEMPAEPPRLPEAATTADGEDTIMADAPVDGVEDWTLQNPIEHAPVPVQSAPQASTLEMDGNISMDGADMTIEQIDAEIEKLKEKLEAERLEDEKKAAAAAVVDSEPPHDYFWKGPISITTSSYSEEYCSIRFIAEPPPPPGQFFVLRVLMQATDSLHFRWTLPISHCPHFLIPAFENPTQFAKVAEGDREDDTEKLDKLADYMEGKDQMTLVNLEDTERAETAEYLFIFPSASEEMATALNTPPSLRGLRNTLIAAYVKKRHPEPFPEGGVITVDTQNPPVEKQVRQDPSYQRALKSLSIPPSLQTQLQTQLSLHNPHSTFAIYSADATHTDPDTLALIKVLQHVDPNPAQVSSRDVNAGSVFIHNNVWGSIGLGELVGLVERRRNLRVGFYAYGGSKDYDPKLSGMRAIWTIGGMVTFTARAIAENPLEYHSFTTRMAQHPFWHAYVHPHTLGLLRDWTEEKDEVLSTPIAMAMVVMAVESNLVALTSCPPSPFIFYHDEYTPFDWANEQNRRALLTPDELLEDCFDSYRKTIKSKPDVERYGAQPENKVREEVVKDLKGMQLQPANMASCRRFVIVAAQNEVVGKAEEVGIEVATFKTFDFGMPGLPPGVS